VGPGERIGQQGRFELLCRLGAGSFGTVFEALDTRYECRVAVKILRRHDPTAIQRFKHEFRSVAEIMHRNLVRLYELAADDDLWFFTMELIDGTSFVAHLTGSPDPIAQTADLAPRTPDTRTFTPSVRTDRQLRDAMLQLAEAVQAVHDARKLHCDIKPSNVLVTDSGRVVLLDFGLVAELDSPHLARGAAGTPGYMAPEQTAGATPTPASDWYSVGIMLQQALTGAPPATETAFPANAPLDLVELCRELTAADPARRPSGVDVIRRLRGAGSRAQRPAYREPQFVGREAQRAALTAAWNVVADARKPVLVRVVGASGMGKTELVRHFLGGLQRGNPDVLVLANRCYEQDSVPYKAIDGVIEMLAEHVVATAPEDATGLAIGEGSPLSHLFPALARAPVNDGVPIRGDSQAVRRRAFVALRGLFQRVARSRPIVLFLDDLQWGDVDSARLLAELLRPPDAPAVLVLGCYRPETESSGFLAALDDLRLGLVEELVTVGELGGDEARELANSAVGGSDALADAIARESGGSPIFIKQLAQQTSTSLGIEGHRSPTLRDAIVAQVRGLEDDARVLVETIAIAGRPIPERIATRAASLDGAPARLATMVARNSRLIATRTVASTLLVEPAHDRVRDAITWSLEAEERTRCHARLAETMLEAGHPDPEPLVSHLLGAGDESRARVFALAAVERAERVYAFDRAAHYYSLILRLTPADAPDRWKLLSQWAQSLANAGRSGEAGEAYVEAAAALSRLAPEERTVVELSRRAAELSLRSGRLEIGAQRMNDVLQRVGVRMPRTRRTASALSVWRRLKLFVRGTRFRARDNPEIPTSTVERLDALWSASSGVSMVNHVLADALGLQHLLESLRSGARSHLVRGLGYEAAFEAVIGGAFLRRRCARLLAQMDELAEPSSDPYDRAWARMSRGITSWFDGDWRATWQACDEAGQIYRERCHGVSWELVVCDAYRLPSLAYIGELGRLGELVPQAYEAARERGDLFGAATLKFGQHALVTLGADRPADAIHDAAAAITEFPRAPYLLPHYHHLLAYAQAEIYRGHPERALERIEREWRDLGGAQLLRVQCLRLEIRHLRARAALATAATLAKGDSRRRRLLRAAASEAAAIARDRIAPAAPLAYGIRAALAALEARPDAAAKQLAAARDGFLAANMGLYARAAAFQLGALLDTDERATASAWMTARAIVRPDAMAAMLMPGF